MLKLSLEFPEYVFILDGEGEESGDIWRSFYKNGKMYTWDEATTSWVEVSNGT